MLTLEKGILIIPTDELRKAIRFEGLEAAETIQQVEDIQRRNRIPMVIPTMPELAKLKRAFFVNEDIVNDPKRFIEFCHGNGLECGEVVTGISYDTFKEQKDCFLCKLGENCTTPEKVRSFNHNCNNSDFIMGVSRHRNFFIKLELGSIVPGMIMINPCKHILSNAMTTEALEEEYQEMKELAEQILIKMFGEGPVIFFEHGSPSDGKSSHLRAIVHAHTHVVHGFVFPQKFKDMVCLKEVRNLRDLAGKKYLSYQEGANGVLLAVSDKSVYVQRQYPRQVIAFLAGVDNAKSNWRVEPFEENMKETLEKWYVVCSEQCKKYPHGAIANCTRDFVESYKIRMAKE